MLFRLLILERMPMKIVVLDGKGLADDDLNYDAFREFGEVTVYDNTDREDVISRIGNSDVIITNKVLLTKEIMDAFVSTILVYEETKTNPETNKEESNLKVEVGFKFEKL